MVNTKWYHKQLFEEYKMKQLKENASNDMNKTFEVNIVVVRVGCVNFSQLMCANECTYKQNSQKTKSTFRAEFCSAFGYTVNLSHMSYIAILYQVTQSCIMMSKCALESLCIVSIQSNFLSSTTMLNRHRKIKTSIPPLCQHFLYSCLYQICWSPNNSRAHWIVGTDVWKWWITLLVTVVSR